MSIAYMETVEIDRIYQQYLTISIMTLITLDQLITVNRNPTISNELSNKKHVNESVEESKML